MPARSMQAGSHVRIGCWLTKRRRVDAVHSIRQAINGTFAVGLSKLLSPAAQRVGLPGASDMRRSRLPASSCCIGFGKDNSLSVGCACPEKPLRRSGTRCSPPECRSLKLKRALQARRHRSSTYHAQTLQQNLARVIEPEDDEIGRRALEVSDPHRRGVAADAGSGLSSRNECKAFAISADDESLERDDIEGYILYATTLRQMARRENQRGKGCIVEQIPVVTRKRRCKVEVIVSSESVRPRVGAPAAGRKR
jgi:hypothetical protein